SRRRAGCCFGEALDLEWVIRWAAAVVLGISPEAGPGTDGCIRGQVDGRRITLQVAVPDQGVVEPRDLEATVGRLVQPVDDGPAQQALELFPKGGPQEPLPR